ADEARPAQADARQDHKTDDGHADVAHPPPIHPTPHSRRLSDLREGEWRGSAPRGQPPQHDSNEDELNSKTLTTTRPARGREKCNVVIMSEQNDVDTIKGWFAGRLPDGWFTGVEVTLEGDQ